MTRISTAALAVSLLLPAGAASAFGVSHHGGIIIDCTPPLFFEEAPAKDAKVAVFQKFSVVASDNTDPETVKVWANNEPVAVKITPQRSGRLLIEGEVAAPVTSGRVWMKATAISNDGCDQLHVWYVYPGN